MGWRSEAGHDRSRVLARCFAGADQGAGAAALTAQLENETWQEASSWKLYCEMLARKAASLGHESCMRLLHELGGNAAASLTAADANGYTPAHVAAHKGHEGCRPQSQNRQSADIAREQRSTARLQTDARPSRDGSERFGSGTQAYGQI